MVQSNIHSFFWKQSLPAESEFEEHGSKKHKSDSLEEETEEWFDEGAQSHVYTSAQEYFWQQYFEVLDVLIQEITRRFDQPAFSVLREMEDILIAPCNGQPIEISSSFQHMYQDDLDFERLKIQLLMLPDLIKTGSKDPIKKVSSVNTLCDLLVPLPKQ